MAARKTVRVDDLRKKVNRMLEKSSDNNQVGRVALAHLLEDVLMETENYKGFGFQDDNDGRTDPSRRYYY